MNLQETLVRTDLPVPRESLIKQLEENARRFGKTAMANQLAEMLNN